MEGGSYLAPGWLARTNGWEGLVRLGDNKYCGATVVSPRHVVSIASCLAGTHDKMEIVTGTDHPGYDNQENQQIVAGKKVINNPNYDATTLANNIAIIELAAPLTINNTTRTVCLPRPGTQYGGSQLWTSYYSTSQEGKQWNLNSGPVHIACDSKCRELFGGNFDPATTMCNHFNRRNAGAWGGFGGSAVTEVKDDHHTLAGVISQMSTGTDHTHKPAQITRVSNFVDWIAATVEGNGDSFAC